MAEGDLEYKIRTLADTHGITEVETALSNLKKSTGQASDATEQHAKHVHELEGQHRALHRAMHAIAEESPILGTALRLALSPASAPIIALTVAFQKLHEAEKQAEEEARKGFEEAAKPL